MRRPAASNWEERNDDTSPCVAGACADGHWCPRSRPDHGFLQGQAGQDDHPYRRGRRRRTLCPAPDAPHDPAHPGHSRTINILNGVYVDNPHGSARFRRVKAPTSTELTRLVHTIARRVGCYLEGQSLLERDTYSLSRRRPNRLTCKTAGLSTLTGAIRSRANFNSRRFRVPRWATGCTASVRRCPQKCSQHDALCACTIHQVIVLESDVLSIRCFLADGTQIVRTYVN